MLHSLVRPVTFCERNFWPCSMARVLCVGGRTALAVVAHADEDVARVAVALVFGHGVEDHEGPVRETTGVLLGEHEEDFDLRHVG